MRRTEASGAGGSTASNAPPSIFPRQQEAHAWPVRAPGKQHLFRHGAAVVSGKAVRLGEWLEHLQAFMADSQVTEVLMFFTQKFTQLDGPVNFTLSTLTDLAWTLVVLVWESALDGKLPFLKEVERKLHESYVKLQEQFFACRTAWLNEISEIRDKSRDKKLSASTQEALHRTMEEDVYQFIPQKALDHEQAEYFVASVKEGVKLVLSRREDHPGTKDADVQTRGPTAVTPRSESGSAGEHDDEQEESTVRQPVERQPPVRRDLARKIHELEKERDLYVAKLEKQTEDTATMRKHLEKMNERLKEAETQKKHLQDELDKGQAAKPQESPAPDYSADLDVTRQQNQSLLERKVWNAEKKLAQAEARIAELEAAAAVAGPPTDTPGDSPAAKSSQRLIAAEARLDELLDEIQKLKEERVALQQNFLHMMEEHEQTLLSSINTDVMQEGKGRLSSLLSRGSTSSRGKKAVIKAVNARLVGMGMGSKQKPRHDVIPSACGVTVDSGVQSLIREAKLDRKADRGDAEDHSANVSIRVTSAPDAVPPPSSPREASEHLGSVLQTRDDDRASRWMDFGPSSTEAMRKTSKRKQAVHADEDVGSPGASSSHPEQATDTPSHHRRMALEVQADAPGYELLAAMRQEVTQRRTGFVARLKEMYREHHDLEEGSLTESLEESLSLDDAFGVPDCDIATQTFEEELKEMPVIGTQAVGGGFIGGEVYRPDHTGVLSVEWLEIAGELAATGISCAQLDTDEGAGADSRAISGFIMAPEGGTGGFGSPVRMQQEVVSLRQSLAEERSARKRADLTLAEMATRMGKMQEELKKRGVQGDVVEDTMAELGLAGITSSPRGCRAVFMRLHRDALERAQRLLARQKEAYDRMQKHFEMDATFRMLIGMQEASEEGSVGSAAFAMRKTMEAFAVLGSNPWRDPLDSEEPSKTLSELSTIAWITDPQVLPFLERDLEVAGIGAGVVSPRGRTSEAMRNSTASRAAERKDAQGWPKPPEGGFGKTWSPTTSTFQLAGKQASTQSSLAQMSTQQLDDGISSLASLSFLEESPSVSTLRQASTSSLPERRLVRNKQRLLLQHGAHPQITFEDYCRRSQNPDDGKANTRQKLPPSLSNIVASGTREPDPGSGTSGTRPETQHAVTYHFDTGWRDAAPLLPELSSTRGGAVDLWRTKSQPTMRCTVTKQVSEQPGGRPVVRIRGSKR